jgi:hypothetical protein
MRFDLQIIASLISEKSRVLDLGCGKGELLKFLIDQKQVRGMGIEIDEHEVYDPEKVINEMLRVGRTGIVSFPCFSHLAIKLQVLFKSQAPVTRELPYEWYNSPNIRVITLRDFRIFCGRRGIRIIKEIAISSHHRDESGKVVGFLPDWFAKYGIFAVTRPDGARD